jgi:Tol biopolymer transport system component
VPGGEQLHPDWSPDGKRIAFSIDGDARTIWVGDADGSKTAKLVDCVAPCVWVDEGAWSPDGRSYAYHRMVSKDGNDVSTLEVLDLASDKTRVVLTAPKGRALYQPRWSPDSSKLVTEFTKGSDDDVVGVALQIVDLTAAKPVAREITEASELTNSPDWSPAGDLIVFAQPSTAAGFDGPSDIVTMHPDGTGRRTVISVQPRGGQTPQPAFSPDGSRIIFVDEASTMMTVALDGSGLAPAVATGSGSGLHPRYRPTP